MKRMTALIFTVALLVSPWIAFGAEADKPSDSSSAVSGVSAKAETIPDAVRSAVGLRQGRVIVTTQTWRGLEVFGGNGVLVDDRHVMTALNLIPFSPEVARGKSTLYFFREKPARLALAEPRARLALLELMEPVAGVGPVDIAASVSAQKYTGAIVNEASGELTPVTLVSETNSAAVAPQPNPGMTGLPFWDDNGKLAFMLYFPVPRPGGAVVSPLDAPGMATTNVIRGFLGLFRNLVAAGDIVSAKEALLIREQQTVFGEIMELYATKSLVKPENLLACAQEMLLIKANEKSCRDRHSFYVPKDYSEVSSSEIMGQFGGVGLELGTQDGKVVVISPIEGTPAHRAGILSGDEVVKVDGVPVEDINGAVRRIRGKAGAKVTIIIRRAGTEKSFELVRESIVIHAVEKKVLPSGIGYLRVKTFSKVMPGEFGAEMEKFRRDGVKRVILDFRNNPGGLMVAALDILYDFAKPGDTLLVRRERNELTVYDLALMKKELKREFGVFRDMRVVVLINNGSASASEIFAGTMKDWGYPVVGSRSFGKGVGQTVFPLSDGSELHLTTFEFLVGNGRAKVREVGVEPTHAVSDPAASTSETLRRDRQLEKAIEILSR